MRPLGASDPSVVGRYRMLAELGRGGMGRVLLGCGPDGRLVALKQVRPQLVEDDGFRARFRREVEASRKVSGAYTAAVVDADPDAPVPWLASAFVPGPSLREAVEATGALPEESVLRLAAGLTAALAEVHRAGLVHRDLKPSNVLLADDGVRVIDFGIARATDSEGGSELTHTGWLVGSPGFMSPEQAEGHDLSPASDVFSLGSVLAMASTGKGPFAGPSTPQTLYNVVHTEPDLTTIPARLRQIIELCLAKDPGARPTPARLLELIDGIEPSAQPWPDAVRQMIARQHTEVAEFLNVTPEQDTHILAGHATNAATLMQPRPPIRQGGAAPLPWGNTAVGGSPGARRASRGVRIGAPAGVVLILALAGILTWVLWPEGGGSGPQGGGLGLSTAAPAATARKIADIPGETRGVALSPDGRTLAIHDQDTLRLWDVAGQRALGQPVTFPYGIGDAAFSPDGRTLATASADGIRLVDMTNPQDSGQTLTDPDEPVRSGGTKLAFSPDGRTLATGGIVGGVRLWDMAGRQPIGQSLGSGGVMSMAFSPDGRTLAVGSIRSGVQLWDVAGQQPIGQPLGGVAIGFGVAFSPDGRTLAVAGGDNNEARLWDIASRQPIGQPMGSGVSDVAFSPDGRILATAGGNAGGDVSARLWDVASQQQIGQPLDDGELRLAFSPDGRTLATGGSTGAHLWDVAGGH